MAQHTRDNQAVILSYDATELHAILREALGLLNDVCDPKPCDLDSHGFCQAHLWFREDPPCPQHRMKAMLRKHGYTPTV